MTQDEELDALVKQAQAAIDQVKPGGILSSNAKLSAALFALYASVPAITTLRAQLAEARAELGRRTDMHECAMAERDDATIYADEQTARANRAEAALAAQIEVDKNIASGFDYGFQSSTAADNRARDIAAAIGSQPHDRSALDRMRAAAREKALREAAASVTLGDTVQGIQRRIRALIDKGGEG